MSKFDINQYTPKESYYSLGEIDVDIVLLESNQPDARTKEYKLWVTHINTLFTKYNQMCKFKAFKLI